MPPRVTVSSVVLARCPDPSQGRIWEWLDRIQVQGRLGGPGCPGLGGIVIRVRKPADSAGRDGRDGRNGRDGRDGTERDGKPIESGLNLREAASAAERPPFPSAGQRMGTRPEPSEAGSGAIQHYLVRSFLRPQGAGTGLFGREAAEKMLSYTTPVHRDGTDGRDGTRRTGRDGTGTGRLKPVIE